MRGVACALAVLSLLLSGLPAAAGPQAGGFDGAVMAELFGRIVDLYVSGRYGEAYRMALNLSGAELPADLGYRHRQVYSILAEIFTLTGEAESLVGEASRVSPEASGEVSRILAGLRSLGLKLYGDKLRLEERLEDYVSALKRYVPEEGRQYYYPYLDLKVEVLEEHIDRVLAGVREAVAMLEERATPLGKCVEVLSYDETVDAGSRLGVRVRLGPIPGVGRCRIGLRVWLGPFFTVERLAEVPALPNATYRVYVDLPDAGSIQLRAPLKYDEELGLYKVEYMGVVFCMDGEGRLLGEEYINGTVLLYRPELEFRLRTAVRYGENVSVEIVSRIPGPVNVTVRLDGEALDNLTLHSGVQTYTVGSARLSKGYHRLSFEVHPASRYVGYTFTFTLAVYGVPLRGVVAYDRLTLYPLAPLVVRGVVGGADSLRLVVVVDGETVYNASVQPSFEASVRLPPPLLLGSSRVVVMVVPANRLYDPLVVEARVLRLNVATVLAFSLLALLLGLRGEAGLGPLLRLQRAEPPVRVGRRVLEYVSPRRIAASMAARIYWALVASFPQVFPRPLDSETLREYLARASARLRGGVARVFEELTMRVELDLYSRRKPGLGEVRRLVEEVRRLIRR